MTLRTTMFALGLIVLAGTNAQAEHRRPLVENFNRANGGGAAVLFDNSHAQTAGNADWTIKGGYSDFADDLRHHGYTVTSHDRGELDGEALKGIKVLVVPEPNTRFTPKEKEAITAFVKNGGGLFAIANHHGSDRNGDGWDAPKAWNEITPTFGITCNDDKHYEDPVAIVVPGSVTTQAAAKIGCWAGCSLTVTAPAKPEYKFSSAQGGNPFVASSTHGNGRVVVVGDSSPFDDGTGAPGDNLHDGYKQHQIPQWGLNVVNWLAGKPFEAIDR